MLLPYVLLTGVSFIWGLNSVFGKAMVAYLPPFAITAGRFSIAAVILIIWLVVKGRPLPPPDTRLPIFILGLAGVFAFNSMLYTGLQYTTAINGALINSFTPIVTIFFCSTGAQGKGELETGGRGTSVSSRGGGNCVQRVCAGCHQPQL
ncbi:MAG: DMT family transporter [Desulfocucumaceae bacterium]